MIVISPLKVDVDQDELIGIHFQLCGNIFGKIAKA